MENSDNNNNNQAPPSGNMPIGMMDRGNNDQQSSNNMNPNIMPNQGAGQEHRLPGYVQQDWQNNN